MCVLEVIGSPSMLRLTRKDAAFQRVLSMMEFICNRIKKKFLFIKSRKRELKAKLMNEVGAMKGEGAKECQCK